MFISVWLGHEYFDSINRLIQLSVIRLSSDHCFCIIHTNHKSAKKTDGFTVFFALLGAAGLKAACKMLMKSTPRKPKFSPEPRAIRRGSRSWGPRGQWRTRCMRTSEPRSCRSSAWGGGGQSYVSQVSQTNFNVTAYQN